MRGFNARMKRITEKEINLYYNGVVVARFLPIDYILLNTHMYCEYVGLFIKEE